jgi:hypothetical protein
MAREGSSGGPAAPARSVMALVALLLASPFAFLLGGPGAPKSSRSSPPPSSSAAEGDGASSAKSSGERCIERFLRPLYDATATAPRADDHLGAALAAQRGSPAPDLAPWVPSLARLREQLLDTPCLGVESIIATVPDPTAAGMGYAFDTAVQALRIGVEQAQPTPNTPRYYRDTQWLPWDDRGGGSGEDSDRDACRRTTPGIVVFRGGSTEKPRLLALLLVGETPTAGVHPAAMANALLLSKVLTDGGKGESCRVDPGERCPLCTKIVGPTFSGGASSLRQAIDQWIHGQHDPAPLRIITGSATGESVARVLRGGDTPAASEHVTFEATTVTAEATACAYYAFLTTRLGVNGADRTARAEGRASGDAAETSTGLAPELLRGVAMLHESGTEFGATSGAARCGFQPEVDISFPVHVSALRSAYDEADQQSEAQDPTIARPTGLQLSLAEKRRTRDEDADMSQTTTNARDLALTNILGAISRDGVRYVGIQSTDIVDAIFLARRIRDVAPDVRLAFFDADALLSHESFRRDLAGSLVVSAYPFLGTNDFTRPAPRMFEELFAPVDSPHRHMPFENSAAEGTFNAMLAARGVSSDQLQEYTFDQGHKAPLPVWVSTIGTRQIVPIAVTRALDCDRTIVGGAQAGERSDAERTLCDAGRSGSTGASGSPSVSPEQRRRDRNQAWNDFSGAQATSLELDRDATPPRVWHFVYAALVIGLLVDKALQTRRRRRFSTAATPRRLASWEDERAFDEVLLRTKWELYAFFRTFVLVFCLAYMTSVYLFVFRTYTFQWQGSVLTTGWLAAVFAAVGALLVGIWDAASSFGRFVSDYAVLAHRFRSWSLLSFIARATGWVDAGAALDRPDTEPEPTIWDRGAAIAGFGEPRSRWEAATTSCAQIRSLLTFSVLTIGAFAFWIGSDAALVSRGAFTIGSHASPAMTLSVLRHLVLSDGVSPATPLLLCAICVYLWACGRMARLYVLHGLARLTPPGAMVELVSTPLHAVCSPPGALVAGAEAEDRGLAAVERELVNAIARPSTGLTYLLTLLVIIAFPVVLFALKRPSTLETASGTYVLMGALALSAILVGATLTQLVQYWLALRNLLRRTMEHPVGRGLGAIAPYARDSLVDLLSRKPDDQLRFVASARDFVGLVVESEALPSESELRHAVEELRWAVPAVEHVRGMALAVALRGRTTTTFEQEAALGSAVLCSTAKLSGLLRDVSRGSLSGSGAPADRKPASPAEGRDALAPVGWKFNEAELAWLERAQGHVATVVALLAVRYVRHFRVFAYTLTACALVLLLAVVSYPFEPHRLLLTGIWVVMLSVVVAGLWVYVELDQNGVMSRISGTEPGKVTINGALAAHLVTWVVLPLLGVAAAQYPQVAKTLFQVVEPFAKALK